jgi:hypothetical protein
MPPHLAAPVRDDEDFFDLPELPEEGDLDDEPLGDDELGLAEETPAESEDVGLDDSAGLEDEAALYALDLPPAERDEAAETDEDDIPVEGLDEGDEYGWTDTGHGEDAEGWDASELDLPALQPLSTEDHGEEGVEEAYGGDGDDDATGLPPLQEEDDGEEGDDELALGEDAFIAEAELDDEGERVQSSGALPPRIDSRACVVEHLGPAGAVYAVDLGPPTRASGRGLFVVGDDRLEARPAAGLERSEVVSVAGEGDTVVVGTRLSGAFRSSDGGASFVAANGWADEDRDTAQGLAVVRERGAGGDPRVWGRTASGALFRSSDGGATWAGPLLLKPVVALATPEDGSLVALCTGRDAPAQVVRSSDGGQRWAAVDGPSLPTHGEPHVAAERDSIAVAVDDDPSGPFLSNDRGKTWARVPGLPPTGPMALTWEPGGLTLYAAHFFDTADRGVVVRHQPGGGESALVLDVAREAEERGLRAAGDPEGDHRVHGLVARREGRHTILLVATGAGLFRVRVDPEPP